VASPIDQAQVTILPELATELLLKFMALLLQYGPVLLKEAVGSSFTVT
jgi:hypothetical protein